MYRVCSPFRGALIHSHTPTQHPHCGSTHPHLLSCEGQTPQIRQLLGDRVVDLVFSFVCFFLKREKHGGMRLAITMLIEFVYNDICGSNTECSFYILYTQNDIKVSRSTEYSIFGLNAACSDF